MSKNTQPIIFLLILFSIVMFLVGFRLGKRVEKIDQNYIAPTSIPLPSPTLQPTATSIPLNFKVYNNKQCGISFLYPATLISDKISSESSKLSDDRNMIILDCTRSEVFDKREALTELEPAKQEILDGTEIDIYDRNNQNQMFILQNRKKGRSVFIEVSKNLTDLILQTVTFQ